MTLVNRLLGLLLGLVLLGAGVLLAVETALAYLDRPPWLVPHEQWVPTLTQLTWNDRTVMAVSALVVLAGVLLIVAQLWPARPRALRLEETRDNRLAAMDGRGMQELVRGSAVDDEDVLDADVRLSRRAARVSGRIPQDARARPVELRTRQRVQERVDDLGLQRRVKVKVRMQRSGARVR